jgi:LysR family transcriptional regulator, regulator of abg operon
MQAPLSSKQLDQLRIRHLKFIRLLSEMGSLAATAEHLSMTPSAASMMLKEIEGIFSVKLFQRQGRGMALTPQGQALLPRCQTVLGEVAAMQTSTGGASTPLLRIGAFPHTTTTLLPKIVHALIESDPRWRVQIIDQSADRLIDMLHAGEIDLMLGRMPQKTAAMQSIDNLAQKRLYESQLAIVASIGHPLTRKKNLRMQDLLDWPWVLPSLHSTTRMALVDAYLRQGLPPPMPTVESPSFFFSLSLLAQSDLLTCCAHSAALQSAHQASILPIDMGFVPTPVALIWRKNAEQAVRAMLLLERVLKNSGIIHHLK